MSDEFVEDVNVEHLRRTHFEQLLEYIEQAEEEGWYYGRKDYFDKRHEELKKWVIGILRMYSEDDVLIVRKYPLKEG